MCAACLDGEDVRGFVIGSQQESRPTPSPSDTAEVTPAPVEPGGV